MEYRKLGRSGPEVSAIGFGCWETGGEYGDYDESSIIQAVHRALDLGVTLFDTARGYGFGRSEELLARALGDHRKDIFLVTKVGIEKNAEGHYYRDSSRECLMAGLESSLRALNTDAVDLLLVHWPDRTRPWEEPMETLAEIVRTGKARYVGVSNFHSTDLRPCAGLTDLITNQVGYNILDRRWEVEMFPTAEELGIGIMAYGPLAHGLLTGTMTADTPIGKGDWRSRGSFFGQPLLAPENLPTNLQVVDRLGEIARSCGVSLPELAVAWVLRNPNVGVALTGVRNPSEIEQNAGAAGVTLDAATLDAIDEAVQGVKGQIAAVPD